MLKTIQSKIIVAVVCAAMIPLSMLLFVHQAIVDEYKEEVVVDFLDTAHLVNDQISSYFLVKAIELRYSATDVELADAGVSSLIDRTSAFMTKNPDFRFVYILGPDHKPVSAILNQKDNAPVVLNDVKNRIEQFNGMLNLQSILASEFKIDDGEVHIGSPVVDNFVNALVASDNQYFPFFIALKNKQNEINSYLLAYLKAEGVGSILAKGVEALGTMGAEDVDISLIDLGGNILISSMESNAEALKPGANMVAHVGVTDVLAKIKKDSQKNPSDVVSGWLIQHSQNSTNDQLINYFMEKYEYGDNFLNWVVIINQPLRLAFETLNQNKSTILLLAAINIPLVIIIGFWVGRRFSSPLKSLVNTMDHYRQGVLDDEVQGVDREDEIGVLAKAFVTFQHNQKQHVKMTEDYLNQYRQLVATQKEADDLLMSSADALVMVDDKGLIAKASHKAYEMFGYGEDELTGCPIEILVPKRFSQHDSMRNKYLKNPKHRPMADFSELWAVKKDKTEFRVSVSLAPTQTMDGRRVVATIRDITKNIQYQEDLRKLATVAENTNNLVAVCDKHGKVEWVNAAFETATGYSLDEVTGVALLEILTGGQKTSLTNEVQDAYEQEHSVRIELHSSTRSGTNLWLDINLQPVLSNFGLEHFVMIATDITAYKLMQKQLVRANDNLEAKVTQRTKALSYALEKADDAAKAKANFLATMSHEIRTPINGVMGMSEILKKTQLDDDQCRMLDSIMSSSKLLRTVIDDILDFSKIEAGKLELKKSECSIIEIFRDVGELLGPLANEKSINFMVACDPLMPNVIADPIRIRQVLYNLVGNAIKFTPAAGYVSVFAELNSRDDKTVDVDLLVKDTGVGIDSKDQKNLFKPFSQIDGSTTRKYGGTGLGLSIVSLLVELMDGILTVNSDPGKGSQFGVHLNLPVVDHSVDKQALSQRKVILAGMSEFARDRLSAMCQQLHAKVNIISSAQELDKLVKGIEPDELRHVVIIAQPDMDHMQLCMDQLSGVLDYHESTKVILLVPQKIENNNPAIIEIINNPLNLNELINYIKNEESAVDKSDDMLLGMVKEITAIDDHTQANDNTDKLVLVAEDNLVNQDLFRLQLDLLGYKSIIVSNGVEALEHMKKGEYVMVLTDCHMPEMDGFQLAREIRKMEEGSNRRVPVIAVTADVLLDKDKLNQDSDFDEYVTKPLSLDKLSGVIKKWMPI